MASLQRLFRAPGGRSTLLQRLALQKVPSPSATIRASTAFHTALSPQISSLTKTAGRLPKRITNQHGIAKRAMVLRANMATAAPSPAPSPSTESSAIKASNSPAENDGAIPWQGLMSSEAVPPEATEVLRRKIDEGLIEVKPDGMVYLPEIWYRSILFDAFGPGGWVMVPVGAPNIGAKVLTREWALFVNGRFASQAVGEGSFFSPETIPRAIESAKSNALMRCCKDLGIASELWDRRFVRKWKSARAQEIWVEHQTLKKKAKIWIRKGDPVEYPFKAIPGPAGAPAAAKTA